MSHTESIDQTVSAPTDIRKFAAEAFGTFVLVFAAVGTAVFAPPVTFGGVGYLGIALAFGFTLLALAFAIGPISGCHVNPAVTLGVFVAGKIEGKLAAGYVVAQFIGATVGAALLLGIRSGLPSFNRNTDGLGANGYGDHSPAFSFTPDNHGYNLVAVLLIEIVLTALLVFVVLASTSKIANAAVAGLPIGITLAVIHLVAIPVDGTSVNPARSFGPALFAGNGALGQLWVFIVFPIVGGVVGAVIYRALFADDAD